MIDEIRLTLDKLSERGANLEISANGSSISKVWVSKKELMKLSDFIRHWSIHLEKKDDELG